MLTAPDGAVPVAYNPARTAAALPAGTWIARPLGVPCFGVPMLLPGLYLVPYQVAELYLR